MPLISVIIPTYNRSWILKDAVDSVLSQKFTDFELIVVDDGSTDSTSELLSAYKDRIIKIRQENRGVSSARNSGLRAASGLYVAFLDSDDMWLPEKLSSQVDFFESHPEAVICQTDEMWIRKGVRVNPKNRHKKPSGMIFEPSLRLCLVSPSAVMMKKSIFDEIGLFNEAFPACEDYDLWLRTGLYYPVHLIERQLVVKRGGHKDQLSGNPGLDKYRIQSIVNILENPGLSSLQRQAAIDMLVEKCAIYAKGCMKRGRLDEAVLYQSIAEQFETSPCRTP